MKSPVKLLIALLFVLATFVSCKKENRDLSDIQYLVVDPLSSDFRKIDKVVSASLMSQTLNEYKIDVNGDSVYDIAFSASARHPNRGFISNASLQTLNNNTEIDVSTQSELFANYTVTYFNPSTNDSITIGYYENYDAGKTYPSNLKTDTLTWYYPKIHHLGDTLNQTADWESGSFILEYNSSEEGWIIKNIHKGIWEGTNNKYVGIRFSNGTKQYYGWVELSVNHYEISLNKYFFKLK